MSTSSKDERAESAFIMFMQTAAIRADVTVCVYYKRVELTLTLGTLSLEQLPSDSNRSLISQAKMDGHSRLYCAILPTTSLVATRGLLPPIAFGRIEPVS